MIEIVRADGASRSLFCNTCAHDWREPIGPRRFTTLDDLVRRARPRREEVQTLAEIGALNAFGYHRREALWQAERAVRPPGELFDTDDAIACRRENAVAPGCATEADKRPAPCPLPAMSRHDRLLADYAGTSLTIGPHPMSMRRGELATRGVLRAIDLPRGRHGRRVRVAGTVITRQRPGTAKGFVFLTLEDETGIANVIVRPDLFAAERTAIIKEPFLLVEGILQMQDGVTSVKAERVEPLEGGRIEIDSHDFH